MLLKKETKETVVVDVQQEIINSAGAIYNYLSSKGEVTLSKLKKDLKLDGNMVGMGLGWLSREDKISYVTKARSVSISLK